MRYLTEENDWNFSGRTAVALGKFEGLHRGHQKLFAEILEAKKRGMESVVFAIDVRKDERILSSEERRDFLEELGIDTLIICPLSRIMYMPPEEFIEKILIGRLHAGLIAVGTDFHFGHDRAGDAALLKQMEAKGLFEAEVIEKECFQGEEISSSRVRGAILKGDMELVVNLLGRPFSYSGTVLHGNHIGHSMGLPTVNLQPPEEKMHPPLGVYVSTVTVKGENGAPDRRYRGITNVGFKPTVGSAFLGVETNILTGEDLELYGRKLEIGLLSFVRSERKFDSIEELREQIERDRLKAESYFKMQPM